MVSHSAVSSSLTPRVSLGKETPTFISGTRLLTYFARQITINDLPVGRSVDETLRLLKAFQFAVRHQPFSCCPLDTCSMCIRIPMARFARWAGPKVVRPSSLILRVPWPTSRPSTTISVCRTALRGSELVRIKTDNPCVHLTGSR